MDPDIFQKQLQTTKNPEHAHQYNFRRVDLQYLDVIVLTRISVLKNFDFRKPGIYDYLLNMIQ